MIVYGGENAIPLKRIAVTWAKFAGKYAIKAHCMDGFSQIRGMAILNTEVYEPLDGSEGFRPDQIEAFARWDAYVNYLETTGMESLDYLYKVVGGYDENTASVILDELYCIMEDYGYIVKPFQGV